MAAQLIRPRACSDSLDHDSGIRFFVHFQTEHVGSCVVSNDIEIVLATCDLGDVNLRSEDPFLVVQGTGQKRPRAG